MAIVKKIARRGFTLIELMIVVVIIGILASLAIYGVQKYVTNSKSAEARMMLGRIAKDASIAFSGENQKYAVLDLGASAAISQRLCDKAAATIPASKDSIKGAKYQSKPSEWKAGDKDTGWFCLKSQMTDPQYFMYGYNATVNVPAKSGDVFSATANGDLDADGTLSTFTMGGTIKAEGTSDLVLVLATTVDESDPAE